MNSTINKVVPVVGRKRRAVRTPIRTGSHQRGTRGVDRSEMLAVALSEFSAKGYDGASLADIGGRLGVSAPLLLYHFGCKEDLWRAAMEVVCARFADVIEAAVDDGRRLDARAAYETLVRRLVFFVASNPDFHRVLIQESGARSPRLQWLVLRHLRAIFAQMQKVHERAVADRAIEAVPFDSVMPMILGAAAHYADSRVLMGMLYGSTDSSITGIGPQAEQVVSFCFEGLSHGFTWPPTAAVAANGCGRPLGGSFVEPLRVASHA